MIGGGGLLGTYLAPMLIAAGHEVVIMDNLSGCDKDRITKGAKLFIGNAGSSDTMKTCFSSIEPDIVFIGISYAIKRGTIYNYHHDTNNTISAADTIGCFLNKKVKHVYYCSTGEVYGGPEPKNPVPENRKIISPNSHFGNANLVAENLLSFRCSELNIPFTVLRIFEMFGPRYEISPRSSPVNFIIESFFSGEQVGITRADRKRDFIFAEEVAEICLKFILLEEEVAGIYNVGTGIGTTYEKICKELYKFIEVAPENNKRFICPSLFKCS
jgi:UDP-glucose 4-epimerase